MSAAGRAARRTAERATETRRRWRRATGAAPLEHARRRVEMAAIAVDEEVGLMRELDDDLSRLEQVVLGLARRRLGRSPGDAGGSPEEA